MENAWADTFLGVSKLDEGARGKVDSYLRWFEPELNPHFDGSSRGTPNSEVWPPWERPISTGWADSTLFGQCTFSSQRVALFLRAVIKNPDIVVLDEAFSGMDASVRDKCMGFLESGIEGFGDGLEQRQALICISHVKEEVPFIVRDWMCLPEAASREGKKAAARFGRLEGPLAGDEGAWREIWEGGGVKGVGRWIGRVKRYRGYAPLSYSAREIE